MSIIAVNPRQTSDPREQRAVFTRTFDGRAGVDFSAKNDAEEFLTRRGFSFGPGCVGNPQGVLYGAWRVAKWRNLTSLQIAQLHGTISGDRRKGPVKVAIFFSAPAFAIATVCEPYTTDRILSTWATR